MDETSKQLISAVYQPISAGPGQVERFDCEYERQAVANLFILFEPLRGWRSLKLTERRARQDWAFLMKELVELHSPKVYVPNVEINRAISNNKPPQGLGAGFAVVYGLNCLNHPLRAVKPAHR